MATHMLDAPAAPSYQPQGPSGNERITVNPTPDAFGASMNRAEQGLGHAMGEAGAAAFKVSDFYSQVAGDDAYYKLQDFGNKLIHGDPSAHATGPDGQPIMGPDGKPMPDTGFMGTRGADTLRRWQEVKQTFDKKVEEIRGGLMSDQQRHAFDSNSRRLRSTLDNQIGSHADQQMKVYGQTTNEAAARTALTTIGLNPDDEGIVKENTEALRHTYTKQVQLSGGGDEAMKDAIARADRDALTARVQMISVNDPARAQKLLDDNKQIAGPAYVQLANGLRHRVDQAVSDKAATEAYGGAKAAAPGKLLPAESTGMVKHFEGFRLQPYWDVNHWRVGYGSDTVTRVDGSVEPVTAMTRITAADAERDLNRRVALSRNQVRDTIGQDVWDKLPENVKAPLASVAYNYGRLPDSVAQAARTGNAQTIAQAIAARGVDNDGVNSKRRAAEAAVAAGGQFGLSGPEAAGGPQPAHALPDAMGSAGMPQSGQPGPAPVLDTGEIAHANLQAAAYARIMADTSLTPEQRQMALHRVDMKIRNDAEMHRQDRAIMNSLISDDLSSLMETGKGIDGLTSERVSETFGTQTQIEFQNERTRAKQFYDETHNYNLLPENEIYASINRIKPSPGMRGYNAQKKYYDKAVQKANDVFSDRIKDPAGSVSSASIVRSALQQTDFSDPSSVARLVGIRMAAQESAGIPEGQRQPMTRSEAIRIMSPIVNALPGTERHLLQQIVPVITKTYGRYADRALQFALEQAKVDADSARVATSIFKKIGLGHPVTPTDTQQLQTAQTNDAMAAAGVVAGQAVAEAAQQQPKTQQADKTQPTNVRPPSEAIRALIQNPTRADEFDALFGKGMAKRVLNEHQTMTKGAMPNG